MYMNFGQKYLYFFKYQTKDCDNVFNKINNKFAIQSKGKNIFFMYIIKYLKVFCKNCEH